MRSRRINEMEEDAESGCNPLGYRELRVTSVKLRVISHVKM